MLRLFFPTKCLPVLLGITVLSGCSTLDRIEDVRDFADRATRVNDQRVRVLGDPALGIDPQPGTVFAEVPVAGEATFTGAAFVTIQNETRRTDVRALVGDAVVTVDFAAPSDAVTGAVTNFRQTQINDISTFVPGQMTFDVGEIGADDPNDLSFAYAGQITADGIDFALNGRLTGKLRGTRTDPEAGQSVVRAIAVQDEDARLRVGGVAYRATISVIGEN